MSMTVSIYRYINIIIINTINGLKALLTLLLIIFIPQWCIKLIKNASKKK